MFNNYEEYMQNVLGMNVPNTYNMQDSMNYYQPRTQNVNLQDVNRLYPEIYKIVYPMVQKACGQRNVSVLNEVQINEIVEEVYNAIEPGDDVPLDRENVRNGDVKNPRAKETRRPNNNYLLRDLIRILIIRELLRRAWWTRKRKTTYATTWRTRHATTYARRTWGRKTTYS